MKHITRYFSAIVKNFEKMMDQKSTVLCLVLPVPILITVFFIET